MEHEALGTLLAIEPVALYGVAQSLCHVHTQLMRTPRVWSKQKESLLLKLLNNLKL